MRKNANYNYKKKNAIIIIRNYFHLENLVFSQGLGYVSGVETSIRNLGLERQTESAVIPSFHGNGREGLHQG